MLPSHEQTRPAGSLLAGLWGPVKSCLISSWQWQHPTRVRHASVWYRQDGCHSSPRDFTRFPARADTDERCCNSCSPSGRTNVLLQQHTWRGGGELYVNLRAVCSHRTRHQVALQVFFHEHPPPNDDVILFRPSSHMAQTGCALLSMWKHFDSDSSPTPQLPLSPSRTRLSGMQKKRQCLFNGIGKLQTPGSPIWPRTHWRPSLMAVTLAVIKSYSRHTNPLHWLDKLLTFPAT